MKAPLRPLASLLDSAALFVDGDWVESKDQDPNGDVRLIQLADVGDGHYIDKSHRFLTSETAKRLKCTYLQAGDVLVARMPDPIGRACIFPGDTKPAVTVVDVCVIRTNHDQTSARWLMHTLNSPSVRGQITGFATGTTRSRISRGNLAKVEIPVPAVHEQRRIAAILDKADALRTRRREVLAQFDRLFQSIFVEMFGDPVANPRKWPKLSLAEVSTRVQIGPFGSQLHEEDYVEGGIPLVNPTHIRRGKIEPDWSLTVPEGKYEELEQYHLAEGDLIVGRRGEMGRCAVVSAKEHGWLCGTGSLFVRPDTMSIEPAYLASVVSSRSMRRHLENLAQGVTMANLNKDIVGALPIALPPLELQRAYLSRVTAVERLAELNRTTQQIEQHLFGSLQHRAFEGEL